MSTFIGKTEQQAIALAEADGWQYEFEGMNCNDWLEDDSECCGWDGISRRCECGNRRVYWETYENDDGTFTAYAQAY